MSIEDWAQLWKWVLLAGVGVFAVLAILVTIGGIADIKKMLVELARRRDHQP
jgi:hypothetical protein